MSDVENCTLSDDECCRGCPLCQHADEPFIDRLDEMEEEMTTTTSEDQVYKSQVETYNNEIANPLKRQGMPYTEITEDDCRRHYKKCKVNVVRQIAADIQTCGQVQENVRKNGLSYRNVETGDVSVNTRMLSEWLKVSRHKLDLLKTYKSVTRPRKTAKETDTYSFN